MTLSPLHRSCVWWAHTLDCLYDSLSSPPVAGVWWAHTLDCPLWLSLLSTRSWCVVESIHLIVSMTLSHPLQPVAGVWWAHTLDCLYDSLSSHTRAGVWWAQTLDCLYDSLSLSTRSWCVVSAYTWLSLWLSLLSSRSWCVVSRIHLIVSMTLSPSPPVAGVWWAHTLDCLYDSLSSPP